MRDEGVREGYQVTVKRSTVSFPASPHLPISPSPHRLGLLSLNATRYQALLNTKTPIMPAAIA